MLIRRHILRALCAAVVVFASAESAKAERRALRRALSNAVQDGHRNSLLQRMFGPGGTAWRGADPPRCANRRGTIQSPPLYRSSSNGTIYDRFSYDSFPGRFAVDTISPDAVDELATSSNYANVYKPATYEVPGMPASSGRLPAAAPAGCAVARGSTQHDIGGAVAAAPAVSEALWQISGQRREAPVTANWSSLPSSPVADRPAASTRRDAAFHDAGRRIDLSLRTGAMAFQRGNYAAAREAYVQSMIMGCNDTRVRLGLALADFAVGEYREASKAVQAELLHAPSLDRSALNMRTAYGRPEEFDAHLAALTAASQAGEDADLLLVLGYMKYFSGDKAGGRAAWQRARSTGKLDQAVGEVVDRISE